MLHPLSSSDSTALWVLMEPLLHRVCHFSTVSHFLKVLSSLLIKLNSMSYYHHSLSLGTPPTPFPIFFLTHLANTQLWWLQLSLNLSLSLCNWTWLEESIALLTSLLFKSVPQALHGPLLLPGIYMLFAQSLLFPTFLEYPFMPSQTSYSYFPILILGSWLDSFFTEKCKTSRREPCRFLHISLQVNFSPHTLPSS